MSMTENKHLVRPIDTAQDERMSAPADDMLAVHQEPRGLTLTHPEADNQQRVSRPAMESEMLTVEEVATMLSIGVRSVWRKAQDGRLPPPIKMTGSTRWAKSTLQDWITEQATAASKKQHTRGRR
jgi:predicted DNA-binding transcriptional regulator AlpA